MPEIVIRYWVDGDGPEPLQDCMEFIEAYDLSGPGESDIVTVFDNDGNIYYHNHGYRGIDETKLFPYPDHCVVRDLMPGAKGCDFEAIKTEYKRELKDDSQTTT